MKKINKRRLVWLSIILCFVGIVLCFTIGFVSLITFLFAYMLVMTIYDTFDLYDVGLLNKD